MARVVHFIRRHAAVLAFAGGFVLDALTLRRIDLLYENVVFLTYLTVAACGILLLHAVETGRVRHPFLLTRRAWLPALVQFPIGGLFSGFVIFYTKSASFLTSWLFLALLAGLFVGNELLKRRYERLAFQVGMFYFVLLSYLVLVVPILLRSIGTFTFLVSGIASLFVIALFLQLFMRLFPDVYAKSVRTLTLTIAGIFLVWNVSYFTNLIPPVPLALRDIGIYHSVVRASEGYRVRYEPAQWYEPWRVSDRFVHLAPGDAAYCFSSVFAPTRFSLTVFHVWYYRGEQGWEQVSRIPFTMSGGRDHGYRGFTLKTNLSEGAWRCAVETDNGQMIGERRFWVRRVSEAPALIEGMR